MDYMKYIIIEYMGLPIPIIFDEILEHRSMAGNSKVLGAGQVSFNVADDLSVGVSCFGESITLGIKSRGKTDAEIISRRVNPSF